MANILLYTLVFPPDQVSNAHILADLVRGLCNLGHNITVLTTTPHYQTIPEELEKQPLNPYHGKWIYKSNFEGTTCYHISVPKNKGGVFKRIYVAFLFHIQSLWFGKRNELDCDIVLTISTPPSTGIFGPIVAKFHNVKSIFIIWDLASENFLSNNRTEKSIFVRLLRWIELQSYRRNDAIVSLSPTPVAIIKSRVPNNKPVMEIPTSVDINVYRPLPRNNEFSTAHGLNDKFVISYLGNVGKYQDFTLFPDVIQKCADIPAKFIIAGSGLKHVELSRQAKELQNPNWEVWGHQPITLTPLINASSDLCLILLSQNVTKGSFPSKLYTIMACAKPVLYYGPCDTDIGRLIRSKNIGWTIETGDIEGFVRIIHEAYNNHELLEDMGRNALSSVTEKYSVQSVAKQYDTLIEELLKS